jgi:hypothetical protein
VNRHVPHSAVADDPKPHKPCPKCGKRIKLQWDKPVVVPAPEHPHHRIFVAEGPPQPIVRYFDDSWREMCEDCVAKRYGAEQVIVTTGGEP